MNRTRFTFFIVLAIVLAIIAASLAFQIISENAALQLFIATTVFSVGVVALDFLGLLGHHGDHDFDPGAGHLEGADLDGGHFDGADLDPGDGGLHDLGSHDTDGGDHGHGDDTLSGHSQPSAAPILSVLSYLRLMVYFCLGFGPVGWVGIATGRGALRSMGMAIPVGLASLLLAQAFFRFQRRDTDSQLSRGDLLSQRATVLVPLDYKNMGKVRIQVGLSITERYALAANPEARFEKGDTVQITKVTDECVFVR